MRLIAASVDTSTLPTFFDSVAEALSDEICGKRFPNEDVAVFFEGVFLFANEDAKTSLVEYLLEKSAIRWLLFQLYPSRVILLKGHPDLVRELWRKRLFRKGGQHLEIYTALLRHQLIPSEELEQSLELAVVSTSGDTPSEVDADVLERAPPVPTSFETAPPGNLSTNGRRMDSRSCPSQSVFLIAMALRRVSASPVPSRPAGLVWRPCPSGPAGCSAQPTSCVS